VAGEMALASFFPLAASVASTASVASAASAEVELLRTCRSVLAMESDILDV